MEKHAHMQRNAVFKMQCNAMNKLVLAFADTSSSNII